ncbi:MAG: hypothetical protein MUC29_08315 [Pyrinomonadaceae bacterium]|jgi:hypothetical protein|nr:hypothetical protein [Pyrinomonadaceae bacterium]
MKQISALKIIGIIITVIILQFTLSINSYSQCVAPMKDGDFEQQRSNTPSSPWVAEGQAGIDRNKGNSQKGRNNAWARNTTGWNAIRQTVRLYAGTTYTLKGYIRSSSNVTDGYFGFRGADQKPVSEIKFGSSTAYKELKVTFKPSRTGNYNIFAGFWSPNADSWIQIDNVSIAFPCDDVVLNPV